MKKPKPRKAAPQKPKPYRTKRFGIANHIGDIWTPVTFGSEMEAKNYLECARDGWPDRVGLRQHEVVPVRVTISIVR